MAAIAESRAWIHRGVVAPVVVCFAAVTFWSKAGAAGSIEPLPYEALNWITAVLLGTAAVIGGVLLRSASANQARAAAWRFGGIVGIAVAFLFLFAARSGSVSECSMPILSGAIGYVVGCLVVGAIVGLGFGSSTLIARSLGRGWRVLVGAPLAWAVALASLFGAFWLYYASFSCLA
jgi:hypothetical protein